MNKDVYKHLSKTYGRSIGVWFSAFLELIRTLSVRVLGGIIAAQATSHLASGNIAAAQFDVLLFLIASATGTLVGAAGEMIGMYSENNRYVVLRLQYYKKFIDKDMAFFRDSQTGYLISLFRQYLDSLIVLSRFLRVDVLRVVVSLVVPVIVLVFADWRLGLISFGIILVQMAYVFWSSAKANKYRAWSHEAYRKTSGEVSDQITNIVAFKSGGAEDRGFEKVKELGKQETHAFWMRRKTTTLLDLPRDIITTIGITIAFYVIVQTAQGGQSVGLIVLTFFYLFQISRAVGDLPSLITQHDDLITKIEPALSILDSTSETIKDPANPKELKIEKGLIEFHNLQFSYPSHGKSGRRIPVFQSLNLKIKGGEQVGVVGLSGAGKSTLASLLMRFDEVTGGEILIDGIDIRDVRQSDLRRAIAYVPQEPLLFHRSIGENIAYFAGDVSQSKVIEAAKAAHAHEFISKLPDGYDTVVGERGVKLSGGQKQRVVIARAILKDAPIMVFDEATSALDSESEQIIQRALPKILGRQTALIIAHRLSTVAGLDRIIVMHGGEIIEQGTHDQLLEKKGRYYALWQKQIAGEET